MVTSISVSSYDLYTQRSHIWRQYDNQSTISLGTVILHLLPIPQCKYKCPHIKVFRTFPSLYKHLTAVYILKRKINISREIAFLVWSLLITYRVYIKFFISILIHTCYYTAFNFVTLVNIKMKEVFLLLDLFEKIAFHYTHNRTCKQK